MYPHIAGKFDYLWKLSVRGPHVYFQMFGAQYWQRETEVSCPFHECFISNSHVHVHAIYSIRKKMIVDKKIFTYRR